MTVSAATKVRENPASFDDHFSQVTLCFHSLTPVEQGHVVTAYTFELSKCWDQTIRERQLVALANIDPDLCQRVADGLGLPAPDPGRSGKFGSVTVHRTYANAASIEFDALLAVGDTPPPPTRYPPSMRRAASVRALTAFAIRGWSSCSRGPWPHAKAIGSVDGTVVLTAVGLQDDSIGVAAGDGVTVAGDIIDLLGSSRLGPVHGQRMTTPHLARRAGSGETPEPARWCCSPPPVRARGARQ